MKSKAKQTCIKYMYTRPYSYVVLSVDTQQCCRFVVSLTVSVQLLKIQHEFISVLLHNGQQKVLLN